MDQHPVPQNISSYEFRLVGDMTLKQFFQLAIGVGFGFLFFKMPLPFFIKWPLIIICVLTGIMLAFVPVGGRPFSQWLMAFFKAIYSPTQWSWKFAPAIAADTPVMEKPTAPKTVLDKFEEQIVGRVTQMFNPHTPATPAAEIVPPATPVTPNPAPEAPTASQIAQPAPFMAEPPAPTDNTTPEVKPGSPTMTTYIKIDAITQKPRLVTEEQDRIEKEQAAKQPIPESKPQPVYQAPPASPYSTTISHQPIAPSAPATTTNSIPSPTRPNIIVGLITTADNQPIEGAIIEISHTQTGIPVRALRSNKTGQFQTATPLNSGEYTLIAEKDTFTFAPASLTVTDQVVQPVLVKAT